MYNDDMAYGPDDWSPADNPLAIAVSEGLWWLSAVRLAAARMRDLGDARSGPVSSAQLDARALIVALAQLLGAERLTHETLAALDVDPVVGRNLAASRSQYLVALQGVQEMRNALIHFEDWARGQGRGPQRQQVMAGDDPRDVASDYWPFVYDTEAQSIRLGPHEFEIAIAVNAATHLYEAIYEASKAVDETWRRQ
ncbi:hypothetical protein GCM10027596_31890 [Nocardioides korecus]